MVPSLKLEVEKISPKEAAKVIDNFIETGKINWEINNESE